MAARINQQFGAHTRRATHDRLAGNFTFVGDFILLFGVIRRRRLGKELAGSEMKCLMPIAKCRMKFVGAASAAAVLLRRFNLFDQ